MSAEPLRQPRKARGSAALAALALALFLVRINVSSSLPAGLYCRLPEHPIAPGALVALCLPAEAAALYRAHARAPVGSCPDRLPPFLKAVAAFGGGVVTFGPQGLRVDGLLLPASAPRLQDSAGRPLPHPPFGTFRLAPGFLWLYAPHPLSFDSRYFGPQPASSVLYRLAPIWLFSSPSLVRLPLFSDHLDWEPLDARP
jgi:conjugative transfer signal peptidase TraF